MNFRASVVALATLALQQAQAYCPQWEPVHSVVTDRQALVGDSTVLESYIMHSGSGYELALYRIGAGDCNPQFPENKSKGPLLFIHGASSDASTWFTKTDDSMDLIGNQYAAEGYDVFFANMRGTIPSRSHDLSNYDPDGFPFQEANFWEFDYNDIAENDI